MRRTSGSRIVWAGMVAVLALLVAGPLAAQQGGSASGQPSITSPYRWINRALRIGVFGGRLETSRGTTGFGPGPAYFGGLDFRARVSSPLSVEVRAGYGKSDLAVIDPRLPDGPAPVDTVSTRWGFIEAGLQFALTGQRTWHRFQPYVLIMGGFLRGFDKPVSPALSDPTDAPFRYTIGTMPVLQPGVGFEWQPADRIGVGFEARDLLMHLKAPPGFFRQDVLDRIDQLGLPAPNDTQWTHNLSLTLTVWRYF
ncbi:MAG TPA: hypothetical protein VKB18_06220 [Gemmatimonadota bacterium]|nr:hypothetical protein [Gemmatimonadota bacterium]